MFHVKHGSRQQEVEIRHGQPVVQREVDAVADEFGCVAHDCVDVARRDGLTVADLDLLLS